MDAEVVAALHGSDAAAAARDRLAGTRDRNFFMYLDGPDHVTIEVQSAMHHDFTHVHLFSDDPAATAAWYQQHLGIATLTKLETVRAFRGIPTGPLASMQLDDLDATLVRLNQAGVRIVSGPRKAGGLRSAFIEAPDRMELEIVEGHAAR